MQLDEFGSIRRRLVVGFCSVVIVLFGGAAGYYALGQGRWAFDDCLYMTAITLSTVGFGEIIDIGSVPGARLYTVLLILFGMGVIVYFGSTVVALVVEGEIKQYFWRKRMVKYIEKLADHIIICGAGATGIYVIKEFLAMRTPFVVIDESEERIRRIIEEETGDFLYIIGDASDDHVLVEAGIHEARGLIAALPEDKENLFVVISARQLNQKLRIVSRGIEPTIAEKLVRVGADSVVSPNRIGGMRMASEMIRPGVVEFLDLMLRGKDINLRVEEVHVRQGSLAAGKALARVNIGSLADVLVVAVKNGAGDFRYNPPPDFVLQEGSILIVLGIVDEVAKLRKAL